MLAECPSEGRVIPHREMCRSANSRDQQPRQPSCHLLHADPSQELTSSVGLVPSYRLKVVCRLRLKVGHDKPENPAWSENAVGLVERTVNVLSGEMLQHVTRVDADRGGVGHRQASGHVGIAYAGWEALRVLAHEAPEQRNPLRPKSERCIKVEPPLRGAVAAAILNVEHSAIFPFLPGRAVNGLDTCSPRGESTSADQMKARQRRLRTVEHSVRPMIPPTSTAPEVSLTRSGGRGIRGLACARRCAARGPGFDMLGSQRLPAERDAATLARCSWFTHGRHLDLNAGADAGWAARGHRLCLNRSACARGSGQAPPSERFRREPAFSACCQIRVTNAPASAGPAGDCSQTVARGISPLP